MIEKPKRGTAKHSGSFTIAALLMLVVMLVIGLGAFFFLMPTTPVEDTAASVSAEQQVGAVSSDSKANPLHQPGCDYVGRNQTDDEMTIYLKDALDAVEVRYEDAVMMVYGEEETCEDTDNDSTFLVVDYLPQITINAADSNGDRGQQIMNLYPHVREILLAAELQMGSLTVIFNQAEGESIEWEVVFNDMETWVLPNYGDDLAYIYNFGLSGE
ncbi:MAG: hypothetical protein H6670_01120 [Anaerolineaceae bacterium]|nr:hypothetical protein [Anaerolineaceae bacterium]